VQEILGRIAISRVFDIEGVWEMLSEVSADCQSHIPVQEPPNLDEKAAESPDRMPDQITAAAKNTRPISPGQNIRAEQEDELEIGDSEAEEEDIDINGDLKEADISHVGNTDLAQNKTNAPATINTALSREDSIFESKPLESKGRTEIIIIDNMTSPINELFSNRERTSGKLRTWLASVASLPQTLSTAYATSANRFPATAHTLLSTFSRTLHTLSQTHNILTILLNSFKTPFASHQNQNQQPPSRVSIPKNPISVFAATTSRPALGRLFSDLCALHLLITHVPKTAKDAELLYASPPDPDGADEEPRPLMRELPQQQQATISEVEYAFVIEVLKDTTPHLDFWLQLQETPSTLSHYTRSLLRQNPHKREREWEPKPDRTQRWAPFVISADGLTLQNAFGPSAAENQMSASGQIRIVKQFPFGRKV
jgi:hypothetical protein